MIYAKRSNNTLKNTGNQTKILTLKTLFFRTALSFKFVPSHSVSILTVHDIAAEQLSTESITS